MVKVKVEKVEDGGAVAGPKVSGKKKKNETKVLQVVAKRNGSADMSPAKKKKTHRGKKNKNKGKTNGTVASPETKNGEPSPTATDTSSNTAEKPVKEEPASTATESGENQAPNTQGKKKRKRKSKNKRKAETLEATEENGTEDQAQEQKGNKRVKVEQTKEGEGDTEGETKEGEGDTEGETKEGEGNTEGEGAKKGAKKVKKEANKEGEKPVSKKKKQQQQEKKHVLFLGNLPFELTDDEVREHFKVAGEIVRVTLMNRKQSGRGKGFGFIEFKDAAAYDKALKLNMSTLKDRKINVQFTTPGKKSKGRQDFIKNKTKKLLGQTKGKKAKAPKKIKTEKKKIKKEIKKEKA